MDFSSKLAVMCIISWWVLGVNLSWDTPSHEARPPQTIPYILIRDARSSSPPTPAKSSSVHPRTPRALLPPSLWWDWVECRKGGHPVALGEGVGTQGNAYLFFSVQRAQTHAPYGVLSLIPALLSFAATSSVAPPPRRLRSCLR
ncbi:hypothetical protein NDU88_003742 [Pleurodeles waltl]|uniref:Uncharacterized protein n=1 Tax=Pleurodeles waltl TaxID=8319 RepID=A0AAV7LGC6_PLEWA|nr:hypothetical protein NDU88_003742 [Pleurodeles waltl]